ncbi:TetR/AcrR family transcriptional regulator [Psychrobacter sp. HD31]|uniref:TetR/AcrR family transcriptional regulator n=1 Tax=Psychrobacter sp. HD31 TaxID=3112003 RepID=UPI003DA67638
MTNLSTNSDDKKIRIMAATIDLVAENGIHATPMSKVSKRANVAAGTIYHYFENKDALIREIYVCIHNANIDALLEIDDINADYKTRFINFWHAFYKRLLIKGQLSFLEQCAVSPLIDEQTLETIDAYAKPMTDFMTMGKQNNYIKTLPDELIYKLTFGTIASTAKLVISDHVELPPAALEQAALFCWDGIKAT